jgi:hypothetical protein
MLMLISTPAVVGIGNTSANAKSIVPKSTFFILQSPSCFRLKPAQGKRCVSGGLDFRLLSVAISSRVYVILRGIGNDIQLYVYR